MDDQEIDEPERESADFIQGLLEAAFDPKEHVASYHGVRNPQEMKEPPSLLQLLDLKEADLSPTARLALRAISEHEPAGTHWTAFRWKLAAFQHLQDVFGAPLHKTDDVLRLFHINYFYYESRHLLAESMLCILNGLTLAGQSLARPFLEFALLQNYYREIVDRGRNYEPLAAYFRDGKSPGWQQLIKKAIPDDPFCKAIRFRVSAHMSGLSDSASHAHHPDFSPGRHRGSKIRMTYEGLLSWYLIDLVLEATLWIYYVNYPMLFHPVNTLRRFGYSGPVGIFIDELGAHHVKRSLTENDYERFRDYSRGRSETADYLKWLEGCPELSDAQIKDTWQDPERDGPFPGLFEGYCLTMAKMRGLRMTMALPPESTRHEDVPDELLKTVHSYEGWQKLSHAKRRAKTKSGGQA